MYELKKIGKVFTSKFVGTGPSSYKKIIYRAAVSQRLRNTGLDDKLGSDTHYGTNTGHGRLRKICRREYLDTATEVRG